MGNDKEFDKDLGESTGGDRAYGYIGIIPPGPIDPLLEPEKYTCPTCGAILADDVFWKDTGSGIRKPFCKECKIPVKYES